MKASLCPIKTDKMYFVAKDDGSREHFFSVNGFEHGRYKDVAAANRSKRESARREADSSKGKSAKKLPKAAPVKADKTGTAPK